MYTLDSYFQTWIKRKRISSKQATAYRYERWYWNHISQSLGKKQLAEITQRDVCRLQEKMSSSYSTSSIHYTTCILKSILNTAVAENLIVENPAARMKAGRTKYNRTECPCHHALTEDEQIRFLQAAQDSYYYEFFALLLLTGLRHGEAAALTWADIDWVGNVIHISRTLTIDLNGHVVIGPPKSKASLREIPLNSHLQKLLRSQAEKTAVLLNASNDNDISGISEKSYLKYTYSINRRIFFHRLHPEGFLNNRTANIELRKILQRASDKGSPLREFTIQNLRDTYAVRFLEQGGDLLTLRTLLGHGTLAMTMNLYGQVKSNLNKRR